MKINLTKIWLTGGSGDTPGPGPSPSLNNCIKFSTLGEAHIGINNTTSLALEASVDGKDWAGWDGSAKTVTSSTPLYVRGKGIVSDENITKTFTCLDDDSEVVVEGTLMALADYEDPNREITSYQFNKLFNKFTCLVDASKLIFPDTTNLRCYTSMFNGCTALKYPPQLPAKTLSQYCYYSMFEGCSRLVESPVLMANTNKSGTTLYYGRMFYNCTSLRQLTAYHTYMSTTSLGPTANWVYGVPDTCMVKKSPFAVATKHYNYWPSTASYQTNGSKSFTMEPATIDSNVTEYKIISSVDGPWQVYDVNANKAFEYPADTYYGPGEVTITLAHPEYLEDWSANEFGLYEYYSSLVYSSSIVNPYYVPTQFTFGQNIVEEDGAYKVDNPIYNEPITIGIESTRNFTSSPALTKIDEGLYEFTPTTFSGTITLTVTATGEKKTIKYTSHYIDINVDDDRAEKDTQGNLSANLNVGDVVENWYVDANKSYTVQMTQEGSSATIEQGIKDGVYNITAVNVGTTVFSFSDGYVTKTITVNVAAEPYKSIIDHMEFVGNLDNVVVTNDGAGHWTITADYIDNDWWGSSVIIYPADGAMLHAVTPEGEYPYTSILTHMYSTGMEIEWVVDPCGTYNLEVTSDDKVETITYTRTNSLDPVLSWWVTTEYYDEETDSNIELGEDIVYDDDRWEGVASVRLSVDNANLLRDKYDYNGILTQNNFINFPVQSVTVDNDNCRINVGRYEDYSAWFLERNGDSYVPGTYNITVSCYDQATGETVVTRTVTVEIYEGQPEPETTHYLKFSSPFWNRFQILAVSTVPDNHIEVSTDGINWRDYQRNEIIEYGDIDAYGYSVYVRGKGHWSRKGGQGNFRYFTTSGPGEVIVTGNVMAMIDWENPSAAVMHDTEFFNMFWRCANLISAPELPATTLANNCYENMFKDCTSLVDAPELPATTLANGCYLGMFEGCTSLVDAPELHGNPEPNCYETMFKDCTSLANVPAIPARQLAVGCCMNMFQGCTSLVNAPELPSILLAEDCYSGMFAECTSLVNAPELPATTLATSCYGDMFSGCTSLVDAPELHATTLANYCYNGMFSECTSLVNAPVLPATTLTEGCYDFLFSGCVNLNSVTMKATNIDIELYPMESWLNMAGEEAFDRILYVDPSMLNDDTINAYKGTFKVKPIGWTPETPEGDYLTFKSLGESYFKIDEEGTVPANDIQWYNNGSWESIAYDQPIPFDSEYPLYVRGKGHWSTASYSATRIISISGDPVKVSGKITSLIDWEHVDNVTMGSYEFGRCFASSLIKDASELILPSTTSEGCYDNMFAWCSSLTSAPKLPATIASGYCYKYMFNGCEQLSKAPELPATTLGPECYRGMFSNCTSLINAPELHCDTLATGCYMQMFEYCYMLSSAPTLNARVVPDYGYYGMFQGCEQLETIIMKGTSLGSLALSGWLVDAGLFGDAVLYVDNSMIDNETIINECGVYRIDSI